MMELTSIGSTSCAFAVRSTSSAIFAGATGGRVTTSLRTSFPVRASTRTTKVFEAALSPSAARRGEAASMVKTSMKQIYTVLFAHATFCPREALGTIISWGEPDPCRQVEGGSGLFIVSPSKPGNWPYEPARSIHLLALH